MDPVFFNLKYAASMRPSQSSTTGSDEQDYARQSDFGDQDELDPFVSQRVQPSSSQYPQDDSQYYDDYSYSTYYDDYGSPGHQ